MSYRINVKGRAAGHLSGYRKYERGMIFDGIREQLSHQPGIETRNRKPLRENPLADWELRIGRFRVFYEIDEGAKVVNVVAIGHKEHERLFLGDREFEL